MADPLIPYLTAPEIPLPFLESLYDFDTPPSIKPFGTLVAIGVYIGSVVTLRRAEQRKFPAKLMSDFIFTVVASGFVISHVLDAIFYHPETVASDPLYLFKVWDGLSSYGGFIGALIGALAFGWKRRINVMEMIDVTVAGMPIAWVFGRAGCSVVHDHPGALSNAWFAVQYPVEKLAPGFAGRFDLGLYECILTIPLAIAVHWLWRRNPYRPVGFYVGLTLTAYAPIRFLLDFLRVGGPFSEGQGAREAHMLGADPRYGGLTPAQWVCFLALAAGIYFLRKALSSEDVKPPEEPEEAPAKRKKRKKRRRAKGEDGQGAPADPGKTTTGEAEDGKIPDLPQDVEGS